MTSRVLSRIAILTALCAATPTVTESAGAQDNSDHSTEFVPTFSFHAVLDPEPLDPTDLDHVTSLRQVQGFQGDAAFVADLYSNPQKYGALRSDRLDEFGNVLLVPEEVDDAEQRAIVEHYASAVQDWAIAFFGDSYAGIYADGLSLVVQCAQCDPDSSEIQATVERDLPSQVAASVTLRSVQFSLGYLMDVQKRASEALLESNIVYNGTGLDVGANQSVAYVLSPYVPAAEELSSSLTAEVSSPYPALRIDADDELVEDYVNKNDYYGSGLIVGGTSIGRNTTAHTCSSALLTYNQWGNFLLTAGHCTINPNGTEPWYQGLNYIGPVTARYQQYAYDVAAIHTDSSGRPVTGRFHINAGQYAEPVQQVIGWDADVVNVHVVCTTGAITTGMDGFSNNSTRCGTLQDRNFQTAGTGLDGQPYAPLWRRATAQVAGGDSGALIYRVVPGTGARQAHGIVRGGGSGITTYSHLPYTLNVLSLNVFFQP